jgi:hypothetical protein
MCSFSPSFWLLLCLRTGVSEETKADVKQQCSNIQVQDYLLLATPEAVAQIIAT